MPQLARRARGGLDFTHFFAATSSTQPTHATLFTGLPPWRHGVTRNGQALAPGAVTLAEMLRDAGWHTMGVVGAFPCSARFGFSQGFAVFDEAFDRGRPDNAMWADRDPEARFYRLGDAVTAEAVRRLDGAPAGPQFLWAHYFDPHSPYGDTTSEERLRPQDLLAIARRGGPLAASLARARSLYDRDVEALDHALETLLLRLDRDADRFETHVLLTADHGESFGEDGSVGHGKRLTEGQVHVPLVLLGRRIAPAVREDVAGSIDVGATLLALAGLPGRFLAGRDLLAPGHQSGGAFGMRRTFARPHVDQRLHGSELLDFDLFFAVDDSGRPFTGNSRGLRDMPDGLAVSPEVERRLLQTFGVLERELHSGVPTRTDPAAEEGLRALGYVG